jgi:hypothetical protein
MTDEITAERIERALVLLAYAITATGEKRAGPLVDRLERELVHYRNAPDPIERARRILADHTLPALTIGDAGQSRRPND